MNAKLSIVTAHEIAWKSTEKDRIYQPTALYSSVCLTVTADTFFHSELSPIPCFMLHGCCLINEPSYPLRVQHTTKR
ncbi:hypothetical protein Pfo_009218 [Paulownia fortunei]|nr:hypothetical protein Pfo_009218 [Paulownia fortunei]